jgi:hypothetical protein
MNTPQDHQNDVPDFDQQLSLLIKALDSRGPALEHLISITRILTAPEHCWRGHSREMQTVCAALRTIADEAESCIIAAEIASTVVPRPDQ